MNLVEMLHEAVRANPSKECLRNKQDGQWHSITYAEFWNEIQYFAIGLKSLGVKEGDKVGLLSNNCPQWAISDYAVLSLGAVVTPIYPTLPSPQVEFILRNADVEYLIVQDQTQLGKILQIWPDKLKCAILIQPETDCADECADRILPFKDVLKLGMKQEGTLGRPDYAAIPESQLATIVHTSGTSGTPKGVMLSHSNITSNIRASLSCLPIHPTDIALSYLPLSHIFERTVGQYAILSSGATIAYAESIETIQVNLQEIRPTVFCTVPRLLEKVYARIHGRVEQSPKLIRKVLERGLANETRSGLAYRIVDRLIYEKVRQGLGGNLRFIVSGGAGLAADISEFFGKAGIDCYEGYGMTEASPVICTNPFGKLRRGTVGVPIPGVEIKLAEDGELLVRGPNVMMGYYKNPEETAKTITPDGWLQTGDIAEIDNGYVKIVDRKKNIIVLATGKNVAPWPVENSISLSPYISQTVLIGDKRQYVTCLIVPDFLALKSVADELQLGDDQGKWVSHPKIRELLRQEVIKYSEPFADFEKPKRAVILSNELTLEGEELTPTMKVRNKTVLQKYGHLIEEMYNGTNYVPIQDGQGHTHPSHDTGHLQI
ncbi:AMP-dependent synthetase/ligase [Effusibacillus lacus]|uniref:Long-chain fatty acid--CoA ligase n=1 Tax=Effusibacillus lacus TaxID=1348429 RepID=A0A292YK22_9BACL|nr:long-chain fatty acid--CoA ligase [Effusibacillus lacus]TCS75154.1 long-chain acyl-CoA synthetase [Effusibacillus lacus]GAX89103.1 long-chain fatty acid--CoA ligase [Effusibacillus lacus]